MNNEAPEQLLDRWKASLCKQVSVGGMLARNSVAHKWRAPYRSLILRESVFWRTHDLLSQAHTLYKNGHILGSRVLLRSALESVGILIYLNQITARVLEGTLNFHSFSEKTSRLLLGSRDGSTKSSSIHINEVLKQSEKKYEGIISIYATLSESAHPNFEGVCLGYSRVDYEQYETSFANHWVEMWADRHDSIVKLIAMVFENEYNNVWTPQLRKLEMWLTENDVELEATKG